jgi:hypothetical protein
LLAASGSGSCGTTSARSSALGQLDGDPMALFASEHNDIQQILRDHGLHYMQHGRDQPG